MNSSTNKSSKTYGPATGIPQVDSFIRYMHLRALQSPRGRSDYVRSLALGLSEWERPALLEEIRERLPVSLEPILDEAEREWEALEWRG